MAFAIYKPGQGYWTRVLTAVGAGTLVLTGVAWVWRLLEPLPNHGLYQGITAVTMIVGLGGLVFYLLNKPRIVDFMIATESEMKKVNWPTRREIIGSTWVVIVGTALMALLLLGVDLGFAWFFKLIRILDI